MLYIGISIIIFGVVLLVMITLTTRPAKLDKSYYEQKWQDIEKLLEGSNSDWYKAVLDADKLFDHAMKASGIQGKTMGERMKNSSHLKNINTAWTAHKLRNKLAHDTSVKLKKNYAKAAARSYHAVLKDLKAL